MRKTDTLADKKARLRKRAAAQAKRAATGEWVGDREHWSPPTATPTEDESDDSESRAHKKEVLMPNLTPTEALAAVKDHRGVMFAATYCHNGKCPLCAALPVLRRALEPPEKTVLSEELRECCPKEVGPCGRCQVCLAADFIDQLLASSADMASFMAGTSLCEGCQVKREERRIIATPRIQVEEERDALRAQLAELCSALQGLDAQMSELTHRLHVIEIVLAAEDAEGD